MTRSKRKGKKGADSLATAVKVIVVSVAVFFVGYYTMFFVVRSITGPFTAAPKVLTQADTGAAQSTETPTKSKSDSSTSASKAATQSASSTASKTNTKSTAPSAATSQPAASSTTTSSSSKSVVANAPSPVKPSISASTEGSASTKKATMWRVRVGNYANREEAAAELALVRTYASGAYIVSDNGIRIQAGAFQDEAAARRLAADLAEQGFTVEVAAVN